MVSSDSQEILEVAQSYGAEAILRPEGLATDTTPSEPVIEHALEVLEAKEGYRPLNLVLLQITSPLRTSEDIEAALAMLDDASDAVISVVEPRHSPYKAFQQTKDGFLVGLVSADAPFRPRQELPLAYMPNGAIYAIRTASFRQEKRLMTERTRPYIMPESRSLDIDTPQDLAEAERLMRSAHFMG